MKITPYRAGRSAVFTVVAALLPVAGASAAPGAWSAAGELAAGYDSNIGNAGSSDDERAAASAYAGASATYERRFGLYTALEARGSLSGEQVFDLEDLSSARAALRLRLLHKPGEGFHVPVLAAWVSAGAREYGSAIRDGAEYRAGVSAAAPLTTAVQVRAEATRSRREADGRVFDLGVFSYGLSADWTVAPRLVVYGGVRIDDGDFAVSAEGHGEIEPKTEHLYLEDRAGAIEPDAAFGEDWWAFRADGRTLLAIAGANVPLTGDLALDLQVQRGESQMGQFSYERWLGSVSLLARW
jgi:hypothetical protein